MTHFTTDDLIDITHPTAPTVAEGDLDTADMTLDEFNALTFTEADALAYEAAHDAAIRREMEESERAAALDADGDSDEDNWC